MKIKNIFNYLILFIITGLVLYFSLKDNFYTIINTIFSMKISYLLVALIFYFLYLILKSVVFTDIAKTFNKKYTFKQSFRTCIETNFFHAITPFSSGGQPYEIYRLTKDNVSAMDAANVSIQSFIIYQIVLVLLGVSAIIYNHFTGVFAQNSILKDLVTLGFSVNFLVIVFLFIITYTKRLKKIILEFIIKFLSKIKIIKNEEKINDKLTKYLNEFDAGAKLLLKDKKRFIKLFTIQFFSLISYYLTPLFIIFALNITSVNMIEAIVTTAYVMIIGSFVPIPGGTGGIEYGFMAFYGTFIKGSSLNAIMLVWRFLTYYFGMILGITVLSLRKKD